jgi:hypothetical protein
VLLLGSLAPPTGAGSLTTSVIGMFPKDIGEFAYADLKTARRLPWFAQFKDQVMPSRFRQFEKFLAAAGIDPDTQVDELAWAAVMPTGQVVKATEMPMDDAQATGTPAKYRHPAAAPGASATETPKDEVPADGPPPGKHRKSDAAPSTPAPAPPGGEQIVGIALGNFSPSSAEKYFEQQKLPVVKIRGYSLFAFGTVTGPTDIFFFFIDSNTSAFGHRQLLEKLIEVRYGGEESLLRNDRLAPLVDEVNGRGVVWAVTDESYTRLGIRQLLPEAGQFPDAEKLFARVKAMTIEVLADRGIETRMNAVCGSTDDANTLSQLLQAGLVYRRYQEAQSNPDLARAIDASTVTASGDRLQVGIALTDDLLIALLRRNTFAVKM